MHEERPIPLTISLGVAVLGPDATHLEGLLAAADRALYRAKSNGRDQVCFAASLVPAPAGAP